MYYFVFDTETTGLDPTQHEILELGGILVDDSLNEISRGTMRLEPEDWSKASKDALAINKINPNKWKPTHNSTSEAIDAMFNFIKKHVGTDTVGLIGHNVQFDISFLQSLLKKHNKEMLFNLRYVIDTMQVVQIWSFYSGVKPRYMSLSYLLQMFGYENNEAHTAMGDIEATLTLLKSMLKDIKLKCIKAEQRKIPME